MKVAHGPLQNYARGSRLGSLYYYNSTTVTLSILGGAAGRVVQRRGDARWWVGAPSNVPGARVEATVGPALPRSGVCVHGPARQNCHTLALSNLRATRRARQGVPCYSKWTYVDMNSWTPSPLMNSLFSSRCLGNYLESHVHSLSLVEGTQRATFCFSRNK